jgi:phosphomethylpyrimidine synthase
MKISQEVRDVAKQAQQQEFEKEKGMKDMADAFNQSGAQLYHKADSKVELP